MQYLRFIRGMIFSPILELIKIKNNKVPTNIIYRVFGLTILIILVKLSFIKWRTSPSTFSNHHLNEIILIPYVRYTISILSYFISIFAIVKLCKYFNRNKDCGNLPSLILSISAIGLVAQILYLPLNYICSKNVLLYLTICLVLWNLTLIMLSVKISSSLSYTKSVCIVVIIIIINMICTFGIGSSMAPYLEFMY
jgi:hypothetical protein